MVSYTEMLDQNKLILAKAAASGSLKKILDPNDPPQAWTFAALELIVSVVVERAIEAYEGIS